MPAPARAAALHVLRAIAAGRSDLGDALSSARDPLPDPRDRALATDLATGTLRWQAALDYQLQLRSAKPLHKLDDVVRHALRLGAYQLMHLERVPISAVVNDSVDMVKTSGVRSAAGFVNAVLRRLARERGTLSWPDRRNIVEYLSVVHSHPSWLVQRWIARVGAEATERWLRFNNDTPAVTLAANRLRGTRDELIARVEAEGLAATACGVAPHGVRVTDGRPLTSQAFAEGYCVVQDEASQVIPELLEAAPEDRVLDACASPGGKTIAAAAQARRGLVVATDVRRKRMQLLARTVARCRAPNVRLVHIGGASPLPFRDASFDRVLIDAPCSGLGTVRRDPDIRWRRMPADFGTLARAQQDLLHRVQRTVRPGGRLVYSTCSSEPEENEQVVSAFLAQHPQFSVLSLEAAALPAAITAMQTPDGYLRTTPDFGLELFFGAILQRD